MIEKHVDNLIAYAIANLSLQEEDIPFAKNAILNILDIHDASPFAMPEGDFCSIETPDSLVAPLYEYALSNGLIVEEERDMFETAILGALTPMPSEVVKEFKRNYESDSPQKALSYLYNLGIKSNYVKLSAIRKNLKWTYLGKKAELEITVNLSKPEKNNKDTAKLLKSVNTSYPKCMLCVENLGYKGRVNYPARQTLRFVPLTLAGEKWHLQYSPYAYFNEHCIIFSSEHRPMSLDKKTFERLIEFVSLFPSYIAGSNANLPIVGGSILTHEHYQGGGHLMPVHFTKERWTFAHDRFPEVRFAVQEWYNSDIRLYSKDKEQLASATEHLREFWQNYSDESVDIIAKTTEQHNTVTPIARKVDGEYSIDLLLRNNRTSETHPDGIFHAHKERHHIKKESIGLIEAMGLFVLPGRLAKEILMIEDILKGKANYSYTSEGDLLYKHKRMIEDLLDEKLKEDEISNRIREYIGEVSEKILEDTAVFKDDQKGRNAFMRFMESAGFVRV